MMLHNGLHAVSEPRAALLRTPSWLPNTFVVQVLQSACCLCVCIARYTLPAFYWPYFTDTREYALVHAYMRRVNFEGETGKPL